MKRTIAAFSLLFIVTGCPAIQPAPFDMRVIPTTIGGAIVGQRCVFLVSVVDLRDKGDCQCPFYISASVPDADTVVEKKYLMAGGLSEISVYPRAVSTSKEGKLDVAITVRSGDAARTRLAEISTITPDDDYLHDEAERLLALFTPWLAENHPELGVTPDTPWQGTMVTPGITIVSHYLFFTPEWEAHLWWHVMIPPHDWVRIEFRRRFSEEAPSAAFELVSQDASPAEIRAITPSETIWR